MIEIFCILSPDFIFDISIKNGVWCKYLVLLWWVYYCWLLLLPWGSQNMFILYIFSKLVLFLSSYWNFFFFSLGLHSHIEPSLNRRKNHACLFTKFQTLGKSFNFRKIIYIYIYIYIYICIYMHIWFKYLCIYIHTCNLYLLKW